jgi:ribonuclease-3
MLTVVNPWNEKNHLITKDHIYEIFERAGFHDPRSKITINNLEYYQTAFIHSSYLRSNYDEGSLIPKPTNVMDLLEPGASDYENQEFLGDRCLDFSVCYYIYRRFPDSDQGFKTVLKTKLVRKGTLARFAKFLDFGRHLIISKHVEEKSELGRNNPRILEDVMEAFICAIFMDQNKNYNYFKDDLFKLGDIRLIGVGWQIANAFIENLIEKTVDFEEMLKEDTNYKEQLLQYFQREFHITPEYIDIKVEGPPNNRIFTQGVLDKEGNVRGYGVGRSKRDAQQSASLEALKYYGVIKPTE